MTTTAPKAVPRDAYSRIYEPQLVEHDYRVQQIDGRLPTDLRGTLYRIGPGRHQVGDTLLHNVFDGDGMVSRFVLDGSSVHYRNRYVRTPVYEQGERGGPSTYRGVGTQAPGGPLRNVGRLPGNVANTNVIKYGEDLLALWELGNPYRLDPDSLETLGPWDFDGKLGYLGAFSAHPKWDPDTGEMFNFGLELAPTPRIRTYKVDRTGQLHHLTEVPMWDLPWNHDFALTKRYLVFVLDPLLPSIPKLAFGTHSFIDSLQFKRSRGTRFVLVPRDGGKPRIVEHDALLHIHMTNAYDDGDDVVVEFVRIDTPWSKVRTLTCQINRETTDELQFPDSRLMQYRVTPTGRVMETELCSTSVEFPQYDWRKSARAHRVSYMAGKSKSSPVYDSVIKCDHPAGKTTTCEFPGGSIGEPLFVPRTPDAAEDDGWLLALNHDLAEHRTQLVVLDARDIEKGPLAVAWLGHHIPWGFHGTFTRRQAHPDAPVPDADHLPSR